MSASKKKLPYTISELLAKLSPQKQKPPIRVSIIKRKSQKALTNLSKPMPAEVELDISSERLPRKIEENKANISVRPLFYLSLASKNGSVSPVKNANGSPLKVSRALTARPKTSSASKNLGNKTTTAEPYQKSTKLNIRNHDIITFLRNRNRYGSKDIQVTGKSCLIK